MKEVTCLAVMIPSPDSQASYPVSPIICANEFDLSVSMPVIEAQTLLGLVCERHLETSYTAKVFQTSDHKWAAVQDMKATPKK
ncbi:hypothetical protein [Pseudomonas sp. 910_21]|uniref:hypothetical protein n=1 Tax=Pseudomonas sp. 910_21 TaxID=2604460 RepID=UPI00406406C8